MLPSPTGSGTKRSAEVQLNRACEACRVSKVRCLVNPDSSSSQCQRCAKAGRQCIFAPPAKRRQRKRTDVRVAELEKELKHLTSLLKPNSTISPVEESEHEFMDEDEPMETPEKDTPANPQSREDSTSQHSPKSKTGWFPTEPYPKPDKPESASDDLLTTDNDIIDRGVITKELAEKLLNIYRKDLFQENPGVTIAKDVTAEQLRVKKPALFHAVMAAASQSLGEKLSSKLHEELVYFYARSLFVKGEKSLQHVQALFVSVAYYTPPNNPGQMQIYQYTNLAASMALELGLASKPRTHEQLPKRAVRSLQRISSAEELLEHCRTILSLYTLIAGLSMRFRRPNILLYNAWMGECEALVAKSPETQDKRLIAWLRLQRIADEAYTAFGLDDASTSFTLSELRLQAILKIFERRMQEWKKAVPEAVMTKSLLMEWHQNMMSMWEFAMDGGRYDAPEFRNRHMTLPSLDEDACIQPESLLSRSSLQVNATIMCISAAHSILECFLTTPVQTLQKSAGVVFVRACVALVVLLKVDYAVGTDAEGMGEVVDSTALKIDYYLDSVLRAMSEAAGPQKCKIPGHWHFIIREKLKTWYDDYQAWRRAGGHLKRKNAQQQAQDPSQAQPVSTSSTMATPSSETSIPSRPSYHPQQPQPQARQSQPQAQQPQSQQPAIPTYTTPHPLPFPASTTFAPWPSPQPQPYHLSSNASLASGDPSTDTTAAGPDMTDFSAAFQNGDLYLWDDAHDSFGGWMPMQMPQGNVVYGGLNTGGPFSTGGGFNVGGL